MPYCLLFFLLFTITTITTIIIIIAISIINVIISFIFYFISVIMLFLPYFNYAVFLSPHVIFFFPSILLPTSEEERVCKLLHGTYMPLRLNHGIDLSS